MAISIQNKYIEYFILIQNLINNAANLLKYYEGSIMLYPDFNKLINDKINHYSKMTISINKFNQDLDFILNKTKSIYESLDGYNKQLSLMYQTELYSTINSIKMSFKS